MKCPTFSSVWLVAINFLYFIAGILFIGLSAWGITQANEDPVTAALPAGGLTTMVVVGVLLMLVAIVGWIGVRFNYNACGRATLGIYATVLVAIMIMQFAAAGVIISFSERLDQFGPSQAVRDYSVFYLINQSYIDCCCAYQRCPNDTCWLPPRLLYPCDSLDTFRAFLTTYIDERLIPIGVIAILVGFVQFFTAITACCSQTQGRQQQTDSQKLAGSVPLDGLYGDNDDFAGGYGYDQYVKPPTSVARPGSAAAVAGASAPARPGARGAPRGAPAGLAKAAPKK